MFTPGYCPFHFRHFCPVGTDDNSPAVHCWDAEIPDSLSEKSRRDGRKWGLRVQPSLQDGRDNWYIYLPSDESLGYCQTTHWVE